VSLPPARVGENSVIRAENRPVPARHPPAFRSTSINGRLRRISHHARPPPSTSSIDPRQSIKIQGARVSIEESVGTAEASLSFAGRTGHINDEPSGSASPNFSNQSVAIAVESLRRPQCDGKVAAKSLTMPREDRGESRRRQVPPRQSRLVGCAMAENGLELAARPAPLHTSDRRTHFERFGRLDGYSELQRGRQQIARGFYLAASSLAAHFNLALAHILTKRIRRR